MLKTMRSLVVVAIAATAVMGCGRGANSASDYKTVHAYNKETGEYFDVKVPYETKVGPRGRISREAPSKSSVEKAVDSATWNAESSSAIDNSIHGTKRSSNSPSPFDNTTFRGSSYHDASSPFDSHSLNGH